MNKICDLLDKLIFYIFLYGFGAILPLYFENKYFNMLEAKNHAFCSIAILLLVMIAINIFLKAINKSLKIIINKQKSGFIILLLAIVLSTIFSFDIFNAITGNQGWYVGSFALISLLLFAIFIEIPGNINIKHFIPIFVTIGIILTTTIFHSLEIDIFNLHENIFDRSYHKYLSTIGNINWFTGYLSIIVPMFLCLYLRTDDKYMSKIYFALSILSLFNVIVLGSDGIYLGLGVSLFGIIPFVCQEKRRIEKLFILTIIWMIELIIFNYAPFFKYCINSMDGFSLLFSSKRMILVLFTFVILEFVVIKILETRDIKKTLSISLLIIFVLFIIVFSCYVLKNTSMDEFGNHRIVAWKRSIEAFVYEFEIQAKLFGTGPELVRNIYSLLSYEYGEIIVCSHSEPIQILLSLGLFGFLSYLYNIYLYIKMFLLNIMSNKSSANIILLICLFSYLGQSIVNSATLCNLATLFLLLLFINKKEIN